MNRQVSGGLMLVLALLTLLVVPTILNPPQVDGVAVIAPPPPAPRGGDCVAETPSGSSTIGITAPMFVPATVVPCTGPHGAEILEVLDVLPVADPAGATDDLTNRCWTAASEVFGTTADSVWRADLNLEIGLVGPDRRQATAGQTWVACTMGPGDASLDQPLSGDGTLRHFGACRLRPAGDEDSLLGVGCTVPHNAESLGSREIAAGAPLTREELAAECRQVVVEATGGSDLSGEPSIEMDLEVWAWFESGETVMVALPLPASAAGGWAQCSVRVTDGRMLVGSLRQIGDAPLPWAP